MSREMLVDALEYYKVNESGYIGVEDYVECDFRFHSDEEKAEVIKFIKENI